MDKPIRRIGVFTSGGDAPGMNAAIRAVVRTALHMGIECIGIRRGYHGLINGDFIPLTFESVSGLSRRGGTMLYSARSEDFKAKLGQECIFAGYERQRHRSSNGRKSHNAKCRASSLFTNFTNKNLS